VLVRNIFDTIVSLADFTGNDEILIPNAHLPLACATWNREQRLGLLVRMAAPWFLNFFASWQDAQHELPALWITYDDVTQGTAQTLRRIAAHTDVAMSPTHIEAAISKVDPSASRFNRGISGRGRSELTESQQQWVRDMAASFHGAYDFSLIGL
jgi:hypothetical protein